MGTISTPCGATLTASELEELGEDEVVSLIRCRLEALKRAGCDALDCLLLATRVDVGLEPAAALVARGCPPALALRILL
jgi:hypothetical protein